MAGEKSGLLPIESGVGIRLLPLELLGRYKPGDPRFMLPKSCVRLSRWCSKLELRAVAMSICEGEKNLVVLWWLSADCV